MSDNIKIGTWENELLNIKLVYIKVKNEFWFVGKETAEILDFGDSVSALRRHAFYDYKLTFRDFLDRFVSKENRDYFKDKIKSERYALTHLWLQERQILINELAVYQLAGKSTSRDVEPFQRWIYETIREIRETGKYCLPEIENLTLEDRKEVTEYTVKYDVPDFVFVYPCGNIERKEYRDLFKEGYDKSKDLIQVDLGSIGGKKSARNTKRARDFCKNLSSEDEEDFLRLSREELYNYIRDLIHISKSIVKEFRS